MSLSVHTRGCRLFRRSAATVFVLLAWLAWPTRAGAQVSSLATRFVFDNTTCTLKSGSGSPEGAVTGKVCDLYVRSNGALTTTVYVKTSGTGMTGWEALGAGTVGGSGTAGYVSKWTGTGTLGNSVIVEAGGDVGLPEVSAGTPLYVSATRSVGTAGEQQTLIVGATYLAADSSLKQVLRVNGLTGNTAGTVDNLTGVTAYNWNDGAGGTTAQSIGFWARNDIAAGRAVTFAMGLSVQNSYLGSGASLNSQYGVYIGSLTSGAANYAIYTVGATPSYFGGNVGFGTPNPVSGAALTSGGNLAFRLVIAPGAPTGGAPTAGGSVNDGAHLYKATFVTAVGETELGTVSSVVTTGGGNNTVPLSAIPLSSDARVTARKLYRTKAGGSSYFLVTTLSDNSTTTYIDAASDASLGADDWTNRNNLTAGVITATDVATYPLGMASTNNTGWGKGVLLANTTGGHLAAFGVYSLLNNTVGNGNSGFGANTLRMTVDGNSNTAGGYGALYTNVSGSGNAAWGVSAGAFNLASGGTFLGALAGLSTTTNGGGVFVGYGAGYHETGAMKLFIDNAMRASEADGRTKALIYGEFAAAVANQYLTVNAQFHVTGTGNSYVLGNLGLGTLTPDYKLQVDGTVAPETTYVSDLGAFTKKWLTLHAAELRVETLVAQETIGTIGGRILVGPTTMLVADLTESATSLHVKHNQLSNDDRVYLEANGAVEFMAVGSPVTRGYAAAVLDDAPLGYWRVGESSGTTAMDWSGNQYDGTYSGGYTLGATGALSDGTTAITLDGTDGAKVTTPGGSTSSINGTNQLTIEMWLNPSALTGLKIFLGCGGTAGTYFGAYGSALYMVVWDGSTQHVTYDGTLTIGQWHHVVLTYDGTTQRVYLNGSPLSPLPWTGNVGIGSTGLILGNYSVSGYGWPGSLDEVAIYNHVLSPAQVAAHYALRTDAGVSGPYVYAVARNLDGSGANAWSAGDAVFNTGTTGDGYIDLYSDRSIRSATQYGPTIVGTVRTGTTYSNLEERWAIGNLNGLYGYSADTYGAAFGSPAGAWVKIDPTNGVRIGHDATTKIHLAADGSASFTGTITAPAGAIGGWTIGATSLTGDTGTVGLSSAVVSGDDVRFWAGDATPSAAEFSVTKAGNVKLGILYAGDWSSAGYYDAYDVIRLYANRYITAYSTLLGGSMKMLGLNDTTGDVEIHTYSDQYKVKVFGYIDSTLGTWGNARYNATAVTGASGTGEKDLQSTTLPEDYLLTAGHSIRIQAKGTFADNAHEKKAALYFGATKVCEITQQAWQNVPWAFDVTAMRLTSTTQQAWGLWSGIGTGATTYLCVASPGENLESGTITIKTTGTSDTTGADITSDTILVNIIR